MIPEDHRTQYIALFLIVLAAGAIIVGERFVWRDLVNFATFCGGGGVGILTGHQLQQSNNGGGTIVNPPNEG